MKTIDRYIARQFLMNVGMLFMFFFSVIIVIDFFLNFDEFVEIAGRLLKADKPEGFKPGFFSQGALATWLVIDLWWPRLLQLYTYLLGLVLVGAAGFTGAYMVKHRELVALMAGGLSLHRVARPMIVVALGLVLLQVVASELVIPRVAHLLTREKGDAGRAGFGAAAKPSQPLCADSQGRLFYARVIDLAAGSIEGLYVWERDEQGLMTRRITARQAVYDPAARVWNLIDGTLESGLNDARGRRVEPIATFATDLDLTALRLRRYEGFSNNLSTASISELLSAYRAQPQPPTSRIERLERVRFGRVAQAAGNVLVLLVCLPFFLRRETANMITQSLYAAPVALIGVVALQLGATASIPGVPPALSVFIPVMVLAPLAIAGLSSIRS